MAGAVRVSIHFAELDCCHSGRRVFGLLRRPRVVVAIEDQSKGVHWSSRLKDGMILWRRLAEPKKINTANVRILAARSGRHCPIGDLDRLYEAIKTKGRLKVPLKFMLVWCCVLMSIVRVASEVNLRPLIGKFST